MGRIGIIGGGHAAIGLVRQLRKSGFTETLDIIEKSNLFPYERPALSKQGLTGELATQDFSLASPKNLEQLGVNFRRQSQVKVLSKIEDSYEVTLSGGSTLRYDLVVLACGMRPRTLDFDVSPMTPVCYLQSLEDMLFLQEHLAEQKSVFVIGAGFIGLEVASSLRSLGHEVIVLERNTQVMNRVLSRQTASFFEAAHRALGIQFIFGSDIKKIDSEGSGRSTFVLGSGERITPDLVMVAIGVEPVTDFIDFPVERVGSHILVDTEGRTSSPNLFAIGDLAARPNPADLKSTVMVQSIDSANQSAVRLASHIVGEKLPSYGDWIPKFWSDQASHKLQIAGLRTESAIGGVRETSDPTQFMTGFFTDGQLIACESVNSPVEFMQARMLMQVAAQISVRDFTDFAFSLKTMGRV